MAQELNLKVAGALVGKSEATLRRLIKSGALSHLPRQASNTPYLVTLEQLEAAGLTPTHDYEAPTQSEPPADTSRLAELEAEVARLKPFEIEAAVNAEAVRQLEARLNDFERLVAPTLARLSKVSEALEALEAGQSVPTHLPTQESTSAQASRRGFFGLRRRAVSK